MCKVSEGNTLFVGELSYSAMTVCTLFETKTQNEENERPLESQLLTEYLIDFNCDNNLYQHNSSSIKDYFNVDLECKTIKAFNIEERIDQFTGVCRCGNQDVVWIDSRRQKLIKGNFFAAKVYGLRFISVETTL